MTVRALNSNETTTPVLNLRGAQRLTTRVVPQDLDTRPPRLCSCQKNYLFSYTGHCINIPYGINIQIY